MRIIGYIGHPELKITVFKMDDKLSVKFENGFFEQTVKIRQIDGLSTLEDITQLVDAEYLEGVQSIFREMEVLRYAAFQRFLPATETEEFETII